MVLPGDPPEVGYGWDECGYCHQELKDGKNLDGSEHICLIEVCPKCLSPLRWDYDDECVVCSNIECDYVVGRDVGIQ